MRADKATSELAAAQIIAATGNPSPCTLGPLCPYCEIERLRADLAAARATIDTMQGGYDRAAKMILDLRSDLAAARALLTKMRDQKNLVMRLCQWHDAIDAVLAGQRREE